MNKNMLPNQSISSHEKETFSSLKNKTANSSSTRKQLEQKTSITITQKSIRSSEAITTFGKNVLLFLNFWKQNSAEKKTESELSITNQSDFDHHALKEIKKNIAMPHQSSNFHDNILCLKKLQFMLRLRTKPRTTMTIMRKKKLKMKKLYRTTKTKNHFS